ncbi:MAG: aminoglycoside phosphotransferase family protein [Dehalobacterium sp.]
MLREHLLQGIEDYVAGDGFRQDMGLGRGEIKVRFLAQGEYNLNYLLGTEKGKYVLRINTASQMELENQIAYEYQALELLADSLVTPRPFYLDDSKQVIPYGLLVMEYLPGAPLDYGQDLVKAAQTFAKIHSLTFEEGRTNFLVPGSEPFSGIYQEAAGLLERFFQCPEADPQVRGILEKVLTAAEVKKKAEKYIVNEPRRVVINTEVNSHNFIVNNERLTCHLIDWEKPILGDPAQDLSMFLIATTTMWKRNYLLSREEEEQFLKEYLKRLKPCSGEKTLRDKVAMFKFFNYLRAISWCAMAWTEYTKPGRLLVNMDTFEKIKIYLDVRFIKNCFPDVFK